MYELREICILFFFLLLQKYISREVVYKFKNIFPKLKKKEKFVDFQNKDLNCKRNIFPMFFMKIYEV